ncbi:MAG TPA: PQQ-dependent sugar dehydrogenase [Myxococcota bacterium]|nr:PQQ-dependent sugar dehydrogenase [Myxococcota bacterium]
MSQRWLVAFAISSVVLAGGCGRCVPTVNAPIMNSLFGWGGDTPSEAEAQSRLSVPPDYELALYAEVPQVRMLLATPRGDLVASIPRQDKVVLLARDKNDDGRPDEVRDLLTGVPRAHGLALSPEGWLYVGAASAIGRVRFDVATGTTQGALEYVVTGLPEGGNHWSRNVGIGPDGKLYVTVGSSCNACVEEDERRAAMLRYEPDGSGYRLYARGLRNAVDFAWRPASGELYATDNGRDLLGDDFPPCELNRIEPGGDYGWPVANGDRVPDPDNGAGQAARIAASIPPVFSFRPHNAPLGITFLSHPSQPLSHQGAALVALHGSWNRTQKDGYKVIALHWNERGEIRSEDFVTGFLEGEEVFGRPVDVVEAPNSGTIFVSDDYAGVVYAITRRGKRAARSETAPAGSVAQPAAADPLAAIDASERAALVAKGESAWNANGCAGCHEAAAADPGMVTKPLERLASRYDVASLTAFFAAPTPPMPAPPLDEPGRRALAAYVLERFGR